MENKKRTRLKNVWLKFFIIANFSNIVWYLIEFRDPSWSEHCEYICFPDFAVNFIFFIFYIVPITFILFLVEYFAKNKLLAINKETIETKNKNRKINYLLFGMILLRFILLFNYWGVFYIPFLSSFENIISKVFLVLFIIVLVIILINYFKKNISRKSFWLSFLIIIIGLSLHFTLFNRNFIREKISGASLNKKFIKKGDFANKAPENFADERPELSNKNNIENENNLSDYAIPEFQITLKLNKKLADELIYYYDEVKETVKFTTKTLAKGDRDCSAKQGPLGALSKRGMSPESTAGRVAEFEDFSLYFFGPHEPCAFIGNELNKELYDLAAKNAGGSYQLGTWNEAKNKYDFVEITKN